MPTQRLRRKLGYKESRHYSKELFPPQHRVKYFNGNIQIFMYFNVVACDDIIQHLLSYKNNNIE